MTFIFVTPFVFLNIMTWYWIRYQGMIKNFQNWSTYNTVAKYEADKKLVHKKIHLKVIPQQYKLIQIFYGRHSFKPPPPTEI